MFQALKNFIEETIMGYGMEEFIVAYQPKEGPTKYHLPIFNTELPYWVSKSMKESGQEFSYQEVEKVGKNKYKKVKGWLTTQEDQTLKLDTKVISHV